MMCDGMQLVSNVPLARVRQKSCLRTEFKKSVTKLGSLCICPSLIRASKLK